MTGRRSGDWYLMYIVCPLLSSLYLMAATSWGLRLGRQVTVPYGIRTQTNIILYLICVLITASIYPPQILAWGVLSLPPPSFRSCHLSVCLNLVQASTHKLHDVSHSHGKSILHASCALSCYFDLLTFSLENMTFTLNILSGPLPGHINLPSDLFTAELFWCFDFWHLTLWPLSWKGCLVNCSKPINDNCFICSGHIILTWDLCTIESLEIMIFDWNLFIQIVVIANPQKLYMTVL